MPRCQDQIAEGHDKLALPLVVPQYMGTTPAVNSKRCPRGACRGDWGRLSPVTSPLSGPLL